MAVFLPFHFQVLRRFRRSYSRRWDANFDRLRGLPDEAHHLAQELKGFA